MSAADNNQRMSRIDPDQSARVAPDYLVATQYCPTNATRMRAISASPKQVAITVPKCLRKSPAEYCVTESWQARLPYEVQSRHFPRHTPCKGAGPREVCLPDTLRRVHNEAVSIKSMAPRLPPYIGC